MLGRCSPPRRKTLKSKGVCNGGPLQSSKKKDTKEQRGNVGPLQSSKKKDPKEQRCNVGPLQSSKKKDPKEQRCNVGPLQSLSEGKRDQEGLERGEERTKRGSRSIIVH